MNTIQLRSYQIKAIDAIQEALARNQKCIVIEMAPGCGKKVILAKTVEILSKQRQGKILVVTGNLVQKERLEDELFVDYYNFIQVDKNSIIIETAQRFLKSQYNRSDEFQTVVLYNVTMPKTMYEIPFYKQKTIIVFSTIGQDHSHRYFSPNEVVFSYNYQDAINEGYITPAMDISALEPVVEVFSKKLLEQFEYIQIDDYSNSQNSGWDFVAYKSSQKIWVDCKVYKSQVVSPSAANSLLNTIIMRKVKQNIPNDDIILLVVSSKIPSFQKDKVYERYKIMVWDIENLVFYSKGSPTLLKQLAQITYFPIDSIEGIPSKEAEQAGLFFVETQEEFIYEAEKEVTETSELIRRLRVCKAGKKHSSVYENVCEEAIRILFEASYFNRLTRQHKTNDEHFRMDLIGSLKINQSNEESMHPLWQMLVQHYNSHFVVFEFKNYSKEIDQNLIYITEKYLFDAALRNVAFIISRKGFSKAAKFAAEGCLKEHGKLILDVTDGDLIKMLESKSDNAADYLLDKLEEFLMGISK